MLPGYRIFSYPASEYDKKYPKIRIEWVFPFTYTKDKKSSEYIDLILKKCDERGDELWLVVKKRLNACIGSDLPVVEPRYC